MDEKLTSDISTLQSVIKEKNVMEKTNHFEEFAPAKINLTLHVGPRLSNVRHSLQSIAVFADVGDRVILEEGAIDFIVTGPFASDLVNERSNLVTRALALLPVATSARITLDKHLPVASGIGGGSAGGSAALCAARNFYNLKISDSDLEHLVVDLDADMPVCVRSYSTLMSGSGETILTPIQLPRLCAVLVNPGVQVPTGLVFCHFDSMGVHGVLKHSVTTNTDVSKTIEVLASARNDLEAAAVDLVPQIREVLVRLRIDSRVRLARMSGSRATCFGLVDDLDIAHDLARLLGKEQSGWWIRTTQLSVVKVSSFDS